VSTYYVAKTGSSDDYDGSEATPWLTIQHAIETMIAGDTTYVKAGTYNERIMIDLAWGHGVTGTAANPINLKNYPGDSPIIDGTGLPVFDPGTGDALFYIHGGDASPLGYWNIEGFEIRNICRADKELYQTPNYGGFKAYGNFNHITLKNLNVHNCADVGIHFNNTADNKASSITIDRCIVADTNYDGGNEAITLQNLTNFVVKNCTAHNTHGLDSLAAQQKAAMSLLGCANGLVYNNEFYNAVAGPSIDTYADGVDNISVYDNHVHSCFHGITVTSEGQQDISNIYVYNNLIIDCPGGWAFAIGKANVPPNRKTTFTNVNFFNNTISNPNWTGSYGTAGYVAIITENGSGPYYIYDSNSSFSFICKNCHIMNNIIDTSAETVDHYSLTTFSVTIPIDEILFDHNLINTNSHEIGITPTAKNSILADPLFQSAATDFHLQSTSPAIGAAYSILAPATDYEGLPRPINNTPDIGALEYRYGQMYYSYLY
jgi:hypothetical protein